MNTDRSLIAYEDEEEEEVLVCHCGSESFRVYADQLCECIECGLLYDSTRVLH